MYCALSPHARHQWNTQNLILGCRRSLFQRNRTERINRTMVAHLTSLQYHTLYIKIYQFLKLHVIFARVFQYTHLSLFVGCLSPPHFVLMFVLSCRVYVDTPWMHHSISGMASQVTGVLIVYFTVCSGEDQSEGNSPVTGVTTSELRRHLSNMGVIF